MNGSSLIRSIESRTATRTFARVHLDDEIRRDAEQAEANARARAERQERQTGRIRAVAEEQIASETRQEAAEERAEKIAARVEQLRPSMTPRVDGRREPTMKKTTTKPKTKAEIETEKNHVRRQRADALQKRRDADPTCSPAFQKCEK